jgi:uncharacterized protein YndB with AHSA1/START domain
MPKSADASLVLVVRRTIAATPERLFDAWTRPEQLRQWWGPARVTCTAAEIDLRAGGSYRIANQFPDGRVVWISGEFLCIERPRELGYTWRLSSQPEPHERVTVRFDRRGAHTEVIVTHERIRHAADRERHEQGWTGCLQGLDTFIARSNG